MGEIERLALNFDGTAMVACASGSYVRYSDHLAALDKVREEVRERLREELAEEFEKRAQIEAEKRARVKKDEAKDRASGKLAKVDSYEATWNYHEGLSCAYQRAASHIRAMLAALGDDPK